MSKQIKHRRSYWELLSTVVVTAVVTVICIIFQDDISQLRHSDLTLVWLVLIYVALFLGWLLLGFFLFLGARQAIDLVRKHVRLRFRRHDVAVGYFIIRGIIVMITLFFWIFPLFVYFNDHFIRAPNIAPVIMLSMFPPAPHVNELVTFNASGAGDPDGTIVSYEWDFNGDGLFDRSTLGSAATYSYSTIGTKTIALRVTDAEGDSSRTTYQFDVRPVESIRLPAGVSPPQSSYGARYYTVYQGGSRVQIRPLEAPSSAVDYYNYMSNHANIGLEEANTAILFLYRDFSSETVSLFVVLSSLTGTAGTATLFVSGVPVGADFLVKDDKSDLRDVWQLTPPTGSVFWAWEEVESDGMVLGPLGSEFELSLYPQFTSGITAVKFLSGNTASPAAISLNLIDPIIVQGTSNMPPVVTFTVSPAEPHINALITFDASRSSDPDGMITSYDWDFDRDGLFDLSTEDPVATHSYSTSGIKNVTLRVTDAEGATAMYTIALSILPRL